MIAEPIGRGDVVWASMDPTLGHEQAGDRPHLVLSTPRHHRAFRVVIAVPLTTSARDWPTRVEVRPGSYAIVEQPRTLSLPRIRKVEAAGLTGPADQVGQILARLVMGPAGRSGR